MLHYASYSDIRSFFRNTTTLALIAHFIPLSTSKMNRMGMGDNNITYVIYVFWGFKVSSGVKIGSKY